MSDDMEILALCNELLRRADHAQIPAFILLAPEEREIPLVIANIRTERVPVLFSDWVKAIHPETIQ